MLGCLIGVTLIQALDEDQLRVCPVRPDLVLQAFYLTSFCSLVLVGGNFRFQRILRERKIYCSAVGFIYMTSAIGALAVAASLFAITPLCREKLSYVTVIGLWTAGFFSFKYGIICSVYCCILFRENGNIGQFKEWYMRRKLNMQAEQCATMIGQIRGLDYFRQIKRDCEAFKELLYLDYLLVPEGKGASPLELLYLRYYKVRPLPLCGNCEYCGIEYKSASRRAKHEYYTKDVNYRSTILISPKVNSESVSSGDYIHASAIEGVRETPSLLSTLSLSANTLKEGGPNRSTVNSSKLPGSRDSKGSPKSKSSDSSRISYSNSIPQSKITSDQTGGFPRCVLVEGIVVCDDHNLHWPCLARHLWALNSCPVCNEKIEIDPLTLAQLP